MPSNILGTNFQFFTPFHRYISSIDLSINMYQVLLQNCFLSFPGLISCGSRTSKGSDLTSHCLHSPKTCFAWIRYHALHNQLWSLEAWSPFYFNSPSTLLIFLRCCKKVTHPVKPDTEETCNNHYEKFRDFIYSKVGPNSCFQLSLIVEYFNLLSTKNFRSSTPKSVQSVSKVSLQRYFEDYDIVNDRGIERII